LPSEGFVLCCFFGWKFNLMTKTLHWIGIKKSISTTTAENDSAINSTTDGQDHSNGSNKYLFSA
jgi:hypothetical protein